MRRFLISTLAGAALLAPAAARAQSLAARIADAPADATVTFEFTPKPGVCGDGESIVMDNDHDDRNVVSFSTNSSSYGTTRGGRFDSNGRLRDCREGPAVVELHRSGRRITNATVRVGAATRPEGVALGVVDAQAATSFLLDEQNLVEKRAAERMLFAATLAPVEIWPQLLRIARSQRIESGVRGSAMFWLADAAGDKATEGLVSIIGNDSDEIEVRKSAVFALSRIDGRDSVTELMRIARTNREPEIRRNAMFWLGRSDDARVVDFFEQILRGN